jgi:hypothetical protein
MPYPTAPAIASSKILLFRVVIRVVNGVVIRVDQYIPVLKEDAEFRYFHIAIEMVHAGAAIVPSSMPGANQQMALQDALSKRPSAAWADAVERMNLSVQIAEREQLFTNRYLGG